jgi:hypothetical protein
MKFSRPPDFLVLFTLSTLCGCIGEVTPARNRQPRAMPPAAAGGGRRGESLSGGAGGGVLAGAGGGALAGAGGGALAGAGGGATVTSGGAGGVGGSAGAGGDDLPISRLDASAAADPPPPPDGKGAQADAGGPDHAPALPAEGFGAGPLIECAAAPSVGRLQLWTAHGNVVPGPPANLLVKVGDRQVAKARFTAVAQPSWSEAVVFLTNAAEASKDLRTSAGFTITYSAVADLWVQLRGTVQRDGGDQHVALLPATRGAVAKHSIRFAPQDWTFLPGLGKPRQPFAEVLRTAVLFNFLGQTNDVVIHDLRFDNYVPACQ